jgi:hypothetical protein
VVYEIMLKSIVRTGPVTCDNITHAHCMLQKHTQNIKHVAFPLQQWLHELASLLLCSCIACLVLIITSTLIKNCCITIHFLKQKMYKHCDIVYHSLFHNFSRLSLKKCCFLVLNQLTAHTNTHNGI